MNYHLHYKNSIDIPLSKWTQQSANIKIYFNNLIQPETEYVILDTKTKIINNYHANFKYTKNVLSIKLHKTLDEHWNDVIFMTNSIYIDIYSKVMLIQKKPFFRNCVFNWKEDIGNFNVRIFAPCRYRRISNYLLVFFENYQKFKFMYTIRNPQIQFIREPNTLIPKKIFQTWKNLDIRNHRIIRNIIALNPEYEYQLCDDQMCEDYMRTNFSGRVYHRYLRLNNPVARADFWRYCVLYREGGIYLDIDCDCKAPFREYIDDKLFMALPFINHNTNNNSQNNSSFNVLIKEKRNENKIFQGFLATIPNNPIFLKVIDMVCDNIDLYIHIYDVLELTGINIFYRAFNSFHNRLVTELYQHTIQNSFYGDTLCGLYRTNIHFNNRVVIKSQEQIPNKSNEVSASYHGDMNIYQDVVYGDDSNSYSIKLNVPKTNLMLISKNDFETINLLYNKEEYTVKLLSHFEKEIVISIINILGSNIHFDLKIAKASEAEAKGALEAEAVAEETELETEEAELETELETVLETEEAELETVEGELETVEGELETEEAEPDQKTIINQVMKDIIRDVENTETKEVCFEIDTLSPSKTKLHISQKDIYMYFDWYYYVARYVDLRRARILNEQRARAHWIRYGCHQGRISSEIHSRFYIN